MTPPFGYNLFLMRAMAPPQISLADIYRSIVPFVAIMTVGLALVMIFPQIAPVAAGMALRKIRARNSPRPHACPNSGWAKFASIRSPRRPLFSG